MCVCVWVGVCECWNLRVHIEREREFPEPLFASDESSE